MGNKSYRAIGGPMGLLAVCMPFKGNTMSARYETVWFPSEMETRMVYRVYSYSTVIAQYDLDTREKLIPDTRYSKTTSRHQMLVRAWLAFNVDIDKEQWKDTGNGYR